MKKQLPFIGISLGDPSGIGPEITVKVLANSLVYKMCRPVVVGNLAILERALTFCQLEDQLDLLPIPLEECTREGLEKIKYRCGVIPVIDLPRESLKQIPPGTLSGDCGDAAFSYVKTVIDLAMKGIIDATVTNPLNKEALHMGGHNFSGHTEIYAHYTNTKKYTMMLVHENLRVVHVSTHVSLREACNLVKKERVLEVIRIANDACRQIGIKQPGIGVAGLNPHAGEGGLFGKEEIDEIIPAIETAREEGIQVDGPIPPDTIFSKARGGWYDVAVAMYHDQGHIALKMEGFVYDRKAGHWKDVSGVNITLGLPIIRTSVDHGTAFDQAGKGIASPKSLFNAIEYAVTMAKAKEEVK